METSSASAGTALLTPVEQRELEADLSLALRIQEGLFPSRRMTFQGWEIAWHLEPVGVVSGDFCDLLVPDSRPDSLFFLVADVCGKGVAASLMMSHLHAIFRTLHSVGLPLEQLLARANRLFCESTLPSSYATLVCGFAGRHGEITLACAGHSPAILVGEGRAVVLDGSGVPLGLFNGSVFPPTSLHLNPGDLLLLYSDGLTEAEDPEGEEYGLSRLRRAAEAAAGQNTEAVSNLVLRNWREFRAGTRATDDVTLLALRRTAPQAHSGACKPSVLN